jgi:hypothetical protein
MAGVSAQEVLVCADGADVCGQYWRTRTVHVRGARASVVRERQG